MKPGEALAEDLRRVGIVLVAAGIVTGLLQGEIGTGAAIYATVIGVGLAIAGYWLHHREETQ